MNSNISVLKGCFSDPSRTLGCIEKNCEMKIIFLVLWELGWDPVKNIVLNFQIPKERIGPGATVSVSGGSSLVFDHFVRNVKRKV